MKLVASLFFVASFFLSVDCSAQYDFRKGYIINNSGDSIRGLIDYANPSTNSTACSFRKDSIAEITSYNPKDIKAYWFDADKIYVSKVAQLGQSKEQLFLEYLVNGIVDLYYLKRSGSEYFFMEKDSILYPLTNEEKIVSENYVRYYKKSNDYVHKLQWLLKDAQSLSNEINTASFNHKDLIRITKDYHEKVCRGEECIVYFNRSKLLNKTKWLVSFGVSVDYTRSNVHPDMYFKNNKVWDYSGPPPFYSYYNIVNTNIPSDDLGQAFVPGVFINVNRNSRWSIQVDAKYQAIDYSWLKVSRIQFLALVNYDLLRYHKLIPYISFGIEANKNLSLKLKDVFIVYDQLAPGSVIVRYTQQLPKSNLKNAHSFGLIYFGCGLKYHLNNRHDLHLSVSWNLSNTQYSTTLNTGPVLITNLGFSQTSCSVGYTF